MYTDEKIGQLERLTELTLAARRTVAALLEIEKGRSNPQMGELYDILVTLENADAPAREILTRLYTDKQANQNAA